MLLDRVDLFAEIRIATLQVNDHANLVTHMHIARQHIAFHQYCTADLDILTNFLHQCRTLFFNTVRTSFKCLDFLNIGFARSECGLSHRFYKLLEAGIFRDEIGFTVDLNQ